MSVQRESVDENPDSVVGAIVKVLDFLELLVLYSLLVLVPRFRTHMLAWCYVMAWTAGLATILACGDLWIGNETLTVLFVVLAAYRMFDILRWWADFLLDRRHWAVVSGERNLVFVVMNPPRSPWSGQSGCLPAETSTARDRLPMPCSYS